MVSVKKLDVCIAGVKVGTLASLLIESTSYGLILFFIRSLSTRSLPQPSGRLSANIPKSPSNGVYDLGIYTFFSNGSEKGLIEYPFISHSSLYSNAHK